MTAAGTESQSSARESTVSEIILLHFVAPYSRREVRLALASSEVDRESPGNALHCASQRGWCPWDLNSSLSFLLVRPDHIETRASLCDRPNKSLLASISAVGML